jgi:hypothetical protein
MATGFDFSSGFKNIQDWRCGSNGRVPALQAHTKPEFKLQFDKKKKSKNINTTLSSQPCYSNRWQA